MYIKSLATNLSLGITQSTAAAEISTPNPREIVMGTRNFPCAEFKNNSDKADKSCKCYNFLIIIVETKIIMFKGQY